MRLYVIHCELSYIYRTFCLHSQGISTNKYQTLLHPTNINISHTTNVQLFSLSDLLIFAIQI